MKQGVELKDLKREKEQVSTTLESVQNELSQVINSSVVVSASTFFFNNVICLLSFSIFVVSNIAEITQLDDHDAPFEHICTISVWLRIIILCPLSDLLPLQY